ncbi:hypothetical protein GCM10027062_32050 [Nocardioides hungaricus]
MTDGSTTPAGWYPSGDGERYWDGTAWTEQTRPAQPQTGSPAQVPQQPVYYQQPPQKKKHTLRNVLLVLVLLMVPFVGGCFAILGLAADSVDKAINDEAKNDKPTAVTEGKAFDHDGFAIADGWKVTPEQFGGATIKNLNVTLEDDQDVPGGGRTALLTFRLYDGKTVVTEIECSSNEMQEGESTKMDCFNTDSKKLGSYDTIKVADAF